MIGRSDTPGPGSPPIEPNGASPEPLSSWLNIHGRQAVHDQAGPAPLGHGVEADRHAGVDDERHDAGPPRAERPGHAPDADDTERERTEDQHGAQQRPWRRRTGSRARRAPPSMVGAGLTEPSPTSR